MAIIKAYTDLEQSKKLSGILPLESADMYWDYDEMQKFHRINWFEDGYNKESQLMFNENNVCAWSLAALLDILSKTAHSIDEDGSVDLGDYKNIEWSLCLTNTGVGLFTANNPVDACYKMIMKLHKLKLL